MTICKSFTKFRNLCISSKYFKCKITSINIEFPIKIDERFKDISVPFFIPDFILLSYELSSFTLKVLCLVILYEYDFKTK